jgi:hypothetical protein
MPALQMLNTRRANEFGDAFEGGRNAAATCSKRAATITSFAAGVAFGGKFLYIHHG